MLVRFGSHRSGAKHPDEIAVIQFIQIDIQLSERGGGGGVGGKKRGKKKVKGRVKSKSGTFSHICVTLRYAALSKRLSVLDEMLSCERMMPCCSSLSRVCVHPHLAGACGAFIDLKLDEMARTV